MSIKLPIQKIGVVGAGTMGHGIAQVFAQAGFEVCLQDVRTNALDRATSNIARSIEKLVAKETLTAKDAELARLRLTTTTDLDALSDVNYVIEAIVEDVTAKRDLFRAIDALVAPDVILASNTSAIAINTIASATTRQPCVLGMHFMNPVPLMPLVELIRGQATSIETVRLSIELIKIIGKTPVEAADRPGFIANRVLMPMINEAIYALMEGVGSAEAIDTVMKVGMNHPMGPLALADLIGLDVCLDIMRVLHEGFGNDKYQPCPLLCQMVEAGTLGRKTGNGFYKY
ncbi:MAG TPA: 3-hydroxyacyl-CoA dehydrogenase NAD-binding domain-containing protein [Vicinamibacterales bacterium]|jgi:3-hydroxybutyryl-CoA dehydrogenase|nr:3-hydroxyacyl-CoA dehydrogenase NAD-binding domain-containing protein [Vicinamibacterales bacterium]|tara:strand:+ start:12508 stop:13368 length:861 start_codon:yes stop_codon:yes gene_type:complete